MRIPSILSEAWRNLSTGASAAAVFACILAAVSGTLGALDGRAVVMLDTSVNEWRGSGASVHILTAPAGIDGAACDALADGAGIAFAGAIREVGGGLALPALPDGPPPLMEVTPGFARLITSVAGGRTANVASAADSGLLLSQDLANALGRDRASLLATSSGTVEVAAVFAVPDDGRIGTLRYAALAPVPSQSVFDACWAEVWPPNPVKEAAISSALVVTAPPDADTGFSQLNERLGTRFPTPDDYANRLTRFAPTAALVAGLLLGFASGWRRRVELSSALHAGVSRHALAFQLAIETAAWAALGTVIAAPAVIWASSAETALAGSGAPAAAALALSTGWVGTTVGVLGAAALIREDRLLSYAKERS